MELDHLLRSHRWLLVGHRLRRGGGLHGNGVLADDGLVGHITRNDGWMGEFFFLKNKFIYCEPLFEFVFLGYSLNFGDVTWDIFNQHL